MNEITLAGALAAGLLSFLSPCVLPLVPAYLSYITGVSVNELREEAGGARRRALVQAVWFVLGFSMIFVALGASASLIGQWLLAHLKLLGKIAGLVIIVFGLHYAGILRIPLLMMEARLDTGRIVARHGFGAMLLGAAFAFGWTPCVGPILGAILTIAGASAELGRGVLLLSVYSLGLAIPFLIAAAATEAFLRFSRSFRRHLVWVERLSGLLLVAVGLLIFLGSFSIISAWLIEHAPWLAELESMVGR